MSIQPEILGAVEFFAQKALAEAKDSDFKRNQKAKTSGYYSLLDELNIKFMELSEVKLRSLLSVQSHVAELCHRMEELVNMVLENKAEAQELETVGSGTKTKTGQKLNLKIAKHGVTAPGWGRIEGDKKRLKFYLHLCLDVLFEVFRSGDRRALIKIERVGRHFHWLVEKHFLDAPFLRLNLSLAPIGGHERGLSAFIGEVGYLIDFSLLFELPAFLRFNQVSLRYLRSFQGIVETCESFLCHLPSIKEALHDSNMTIFECRIKKKYCDFSTYSEFLAHFCQIMPNFDTSCGYSFVFHSNMESDANENVIASILEIPLIALSSHIKITQFSNNPPIAKFPIEAISNWLHQHHPECKSIDKKQQHRLLVLICSVHKAHAQTQIYEICDFLKQKFSNDELPTIPFTFQFTFDSYDFFSEPQREDTFLNKATNEQFSISKQTNNKIEIKRTRALKKGEKNPEHRKGAIKWNVSGWKPTMEELASAYNVRW